ncbi:alpha/beta hydrolase [Actinomadura parmotrematis]|uniref:Alpha/beta hydrolase n=1 Tax=Actinomadura parmotrematis TaxID=2864039 RepID=A0ABS7G5R9_9ACTN|nr:alpha/beta hydrolase [Actinomadura parmotrematis]MBW8487720.1 alpha/beta hydrolase [Actinomadura parmotrematis]
MGRDAEYLAFLRRRRAAAGARPRGDGSLRAARAEHAADLADLPRPALAVVRDLTLPGPGGLLRARLYRRDPLPPPGAGGNAGGGVLVYLHGGGWVLGDVESYDPVVRALAAASGATVVSVDYRRPPRHPYPAALEDAEAAWEWACGHAAELGADAAAIGIGGDSAGGQIAAACSVRLRDRGAAVPAVQALAYPAVDLRAVPPPLPDPDGLQTAGTGADEGTARALALYLDGADPRDPHVSPLLVADPAGLPPAVIATAQYDPLRPQAERYAARLRDAGVPVTLVEGTGLDHGFLGWGSYAAAVRRAVDAFGTAVADALAAARAG